MRNDLLILYSRFCLIRSKKRHVQSSQYCVEMLFSYDVQRGSWEQACEGNFCEEGKMKGKYHIIVSNEKVKYEFDIRRNITIIKGDSATGKTTLVEMIREYYESGENSGVLLRCDRECRVLSGRDWKVILQATEGCIIFIDEENDFLPTDEFARSVQGSDNYFVIVTREGLPNLPYSIDEIYGIRVSGKYAGLRQTYNEFYHIYVRS